MVQTILSALTPIVFTLLLGFVAAWRHDFELDVHNRGFHRPDTISDSAAEGDLP